MKRNQLFLLIVIIVNFNFAKATSNLMADTKFDSKSVNFTNNVILENLSLKIGDTRIGGGVIFYIDGNRLWECSKILGEKNWSEAKILCTEYRGGNYDAWVQKFFDDGRGYYCDKKSSNYVLAVRCFSIEE